MRASFFFFLLKRLDTCLPAAGLPIRRGGQVSFFFLSQRRQAAKKSNRSLPLFSRLSLLATCLPSAAADFASLRLCEPFFFSFFLSQSLPQAGYFVQSCFF
jgi:hypothetical protein